MARTLSAVTPASVSAGALLALLLGALAGCGDASPRLQPVPPEGVILAFGDSLTHGTGARPGESYPELLAALSGRRVVNAGVPGELSADGLARLPALLERHRPQLVLLCHGGNDILRKRDPRETSRNLREMISLVRSHGAEVVLIGIPKPGLFLGTAGFYEQVAAAMDVPLEAEVFADVLAKASLKSDAVHPNAAGYRLVAERLYAFLYDAGAF